MVLVRGSSHYVVQVERLLFKLLQGKGRSPLKYIMSVLLLDFEYFILKKFDLLARVWVSLDVPKLLLRGQILEAKSTKKVLPCRHFRGLSPLEFGH